MRVIRVHIIFLFVFLNYGTSFGQKTPDILSQEGRFKIDYIKGCAPLTVKVADNFSGYVEGGVISYNFNFDPGNPNVGFAATKEHTFNTPGTYIVGQALTTEINGTKVPMRDQITVVVYPPTAPDFKVILCDNHRATVEISEDIYDKYRIYFSQSSTAFSEINKGDPAPIHTYLGSTIDAITVQGLFNSDGNDQQCNSSTTNNVTTIDQILQPVLKGVEVLNIDEIAGFIELTIENPQNNVYYQLEYSEGGTNNFQVVEVFKNEPNPIVQNLDTKNKFYCFRITPVDGCNNGLPSSNTICSIVLNAEATNNQNVLTWSTSTDPSIRMEFVDVYANDNIIGSADYPAISYSDINIDCGVEYNYKIVATNNGYSSSSAVQTLIGNKVYAPPGIENVIASFSNNGDALDMLWLEPLGVDVVEYTVLRIDNGNEWTTDTETIQIPAPTGSVCYQINYKDDCDNASQSGAMICPVFLSEVSENNIKVIRWTNYSGWVNGIDYYILEKRDTEGNLIEEVELSGLENEYLETPGQDHQVIFYRILAITDDQYPRTIFSNEIRVSYTGNFYFPTAFTPDGDTKNDSFKVIGHYFKEYELVIYNKWGELIFTTNNPAQGWDGTYRNTDAPQGTYIYSATIIDTEGKRYQRNGSVVLLRK